jgi:hypothetical protein
MVLKKKLWEKYDKAKAKELKKKNSNSQKK